MDSKQNREYIYIEIINEHIVQQLSWNKCSLTCRGIENVIQADKQKMTSKFVSKGTPQFPITSLFY